MKKIMTFALGLSLILAAVSVPAQAAGKKRSHIKHAKRANPSKRTKKSAQ